jgi:hypothetical protein
VLDGSVNAILHIVRFAVYVVGLVLRREEALISASERSRAEAARVNAWLRTQVDPRTTFRKENSG